MKAREFWIDEAGIVFEVSTIPIKGAIHVIEYSAYEELQKELETMDKNLINYSKAIADLRVQNEDMLNHSLNQTHEMERVTIALQETTKQLEWLNGMNPMASTNVVLKKAQKVLK